MQPAAWPPKKPLITFLSTGAAPRGRIERLLGWLEQNDHLDAELLLAGRIDGEPVHHKQFRHVPLETSSAARHALGKHVWEVADDSLPDAAAVDRAIFDAESPEGLATLGRRFDDKPSRRPTLLVALPFFAIGGAERLLSEIGGELARAGWATIFVASLPTEQSQGDAKEWFRAASDQVFDLPAEIAAERHAEFLTYLAASRRADVLLIAGSALAYDCLPALKAARPSMKVVDLLFNEVGHIANNRKWAGQIDLHMVEGRQVQDALIRLGEAPYRTRLVESGVRLDAWQPRPRDDEMAKALGLSEQATVVGFVGRWSPEKDPLAMIEIAERLPRDREITVLMCGTGAMEGEIKDRLQQSGLGADRFRLVGYVADLGRLMSVLDAVIIPSQLDGRPILAMESQAAGVPVIASRVGSLSDLVIHGETGWLCQAGDYDDFARRVTWMVDNADKAAAMGRTARANAEQRFDLTKSVAAYRDALAAIAGLPR